ncbi:MAG: glycoside hydrolase family 88 protein [Bacteroidales bacterium]|nr:glycoside hydrolase family 88 protein [Bacteroidales bacterium]
MNTHTRKCLLLVSGLSFFLTTAVASIVDQDSIDFQSGNILEKAYKVDNYIRFIKHPDYWNNTVVGGKSRPSNIWTRAVFYEGHMALFHVTQDTAVYNYAYNWGKAHEWAMAYKKNSTTDGDNQCCGQTYMELYEIAPETEMLSNIKASLDYCINRNSYRNWTWIDAIQMAMPAYTQLGNITQDKQYHDYMYHSYRYSRDSIDVTGLYNPEEGLWWRDKDFNPPHLNGNGKQVYWSRGNGWVYAALVRVLSLLPQTDLHYSLYLNDYLAMSKALLACQRADGFWNSNLADPNDYGGKETSGTALFVYGFAWGLNQQFLDRSEYLEATRKGWLAMSREAIHDNGFLGWMQGTGKQPSDGQPLSYTKVPNFEDYGAGCVLLAAAETYTLAKQLEKENISRTTAHSPNELRLAVSDKQLTIQQAMHASIRIYNLSGHKIFEQLHIDSDAYTISTANWTQGIYLAEIQQDGRSIKHHLLIE